MVFDKQRRKADSDRNRIMKIEDKLMQAGLNQTLIEFYHARTRNKSEITEIWAWPHSWKNRSGTEVKAMAKLASGRLVCYVLDAKIRNKRLNILMNV